MAETKITSEFTLDDPTETLEFRFLDQNGNISKNSLKSALKPPYPVTYYVTIILSIISLIIFLLWHYGVIFGTKLGYFCNDPLFSHKYTGDTISAPLLGVAIALQFILTNFLIEYIRQGSFKESFSQQSILELYLYFKQFIIGLLLVVGTTEIPKMIVSEHRPHFFDTCMPDANFNCINGTYISTFTCTNSEVTYLQILDSSKSFPSLHSSVSWFTALFTAYIVHSRLPVKRTGIAFKVVLLLICLTFGLIGSLTRITDRRHHWWDVLVGSIIGVLGTAYMIRVSGKQFKILKEQIRITEERKIYEIKDIEMALNV